MTRSRRLVVIGIAVLVVVAIAGSLVIAAFSGPPAGPGAAPSATAGAGPPADSTPSNQASASPSTPPSPSGAASALLPVYSEPFTAEAAGAESDRVGDLMVGFVDAAEAGEGNVVNDDAVSQVVTDDAGGGYYGVLHTLTLEPRVDAEGQVASLERALAAGGWVEREVPDAEGQFLLAFSSGADDSRSWFVVVAADLTDPGQPVVSIQLASPTIP